MRLGVGVVIIIFFFFTTTSQKRHFSQSSIDYQGGKTTRSEPCFGLGRSDYDYQLGLLRRAPSRVTADYHG